MESTIRTSSPRNNSAQQQMKFQSESPRRAGPSSWSELRRQYVQKRYLCSWILAALFPFILLRFIFLYDFTIPFQSPSSSPIGIESEELVVYRNPRIIPGSPPATGSDVKPTFTNEGALIRPDEDAWITHDNWINHENSPRTKRRKNNGPPHQKIPKENGKVPRRFHPPVPTDVENFGVPEDNEKEESVDWVMAEEEQESKTDKDTTPAKEIPLEEKEKVEDEEGKEVAEAAEAAQPNNVEEEKKMRDENEKEAEEQKNADDQTWADEQRENEEKAASEEMKAAQERQVEEKMKEQEEKRANEQRGGEQIHAEEKKQPVETKQGEDKEAAQEREVEEKKNQEEQKRADEQREVEQNDSAEKKQGEEKRKEDEQKQPEEKRKGEEQKKPDEEREARQNDPVEKKQVTQEDGEEKKTEEKKKKADEQTEALDNDAEAKERPEDINQGEEQSESAEKVDEKEKEEEERYEDTGPTEKVTIPVDSSGEATSAAGECDLFDGNWEDDPEGPLYTNSTCFYIQSTQNCMSNGRPDTDYLYWKWKPRSCDLPRFDARAFLEAFRGKTIGFVGDSLARNQMQSLLCMLSQIEIPTETYQSEDDKTVRWLYVQHQVTLAVVWSPYLLKESDKGIMGFEKGQSVLYLDVLDTFWTSVMPDFDIIVLSIGQWYFKSSVYIMQDEVIGCHYCPTLNLTEIGFYEAYRHGVRQVLKTVAAEFKGVAIMSTFAISHFEDGDWNTGGQCRRKRPLLVEESLSFPDLQNDMHDIVTSEYFSIANDTSKLNENVHLEFLDVTKVSLLRADGHPGAYRAVHPYEGRNPDERVPNDCLHWCLPGPVDTWNQLLVKLAHKYL